MAVWRFDPATPLLLPREGESAASVGYGGWYPPLVFKAH
jgi:hypothetical protein